MRSFPQAVQFRGDRFIEDSAKFPAGAYSNPAKKLVGAVYSQPIYLHERYFANKAELPGLLYTLFVPTLEERYLKQHPEIEPGDVEIDDLAEKNESWLHSVRHPAAKVA